MGTCGAVCNGSCAAFFDRNGNHTYTYTYTRKRVNTMAETIMQNTKRAAIKAFLRNQVEFKIYGITLRFKHAYGRFWQCLLPDGGEVFRMVRMANGGVTIMEV